MKEEESGHDNNSVQKLHLGVSLKHWAKSAIKPT